jgi:hypothetical protein
MVPNVSYSLRVPNVASVLTSGMTRKTRYNVVMKNVKPMVNPAFRIITVGTAAAAEPMKTMERHVVANVLPKERHVTIIQPATFVATEASMLLRKVVMYVTITITTTAYRQFHRRIVLASCHNSGRTYT